MITAEQIEMPSWPRRPVSSRPSNEPPPTSTNCQMADAPKAPTAKSTTAGPVEGAVPGAATEHHGREGDHRGRVDRGHGDQRPVGAQRGSRLGPEIPSASARPVAPDGELQGPGRHQHQNDRRRHGHPAGDALHDRLKAGPADRGDDRVPAVDRRDAQGRPGCDRKPLAGREPDQVGCRLRRWAWPRPGRPALRRRDR